MIAKTQEQIEKLRQAGKILAGALQELSVLVAPGVSTAELDLAAENFIRAHGAIPSFLNYKPDGASTPFPAALCISINEEVVHGIPSEARKLKAGDIVSLDLGLSYEGYFVDSAVTVPVGAISSEDHALLAANQEAIDAAIAAVRVGGHTGDVGAAVVRVARAHKLGVVEDLGGHATGAAVHEKPFIANEGNEGEGEEIKEGMVLAIEPMLAQGKGAIELEADDWTYRMRDGKKSAHFEHTILVTKDGPEILTTL